MDEEVQVNYVLIVRKAPLLLGLSIFFFAMGYRCYTEWVALEPVEESED